MPVSRLDKVDLNWIVPELRKLPQQSTAFADVPDDPQWVMTTLGGMFDGGMFGVGIGELGSFLLAMPMRPWYADRLEVHEIILWVPQEYRGTMTALRIIRKFVEVAKEYEPHSIHAGATLDIVDTDRVLSVYERAGFVRDGHGVIMRL